VHGHPTIAPVLSMRRLALPALLGLLAVAALLLAVMHPAAAQEPTTVATVTADASVSTSSTAIDGSAAIIEGGNTPQPVGRAEPPRAQRIGDSLVWLWVMALLVVGGLVGAFARRRPAHAGDDAATAATPAAAAASADAEGDDPAGR